MKFLGGDFTNSDNVSAFEAGGGSENALETNPAAPLQGWRPILFNPETGKAENPDSITTENFLLDYHAGDTLPYPWELLDSPFGYAAIDPDGYRFDVLKRPYTEPDAYGNPIVNIGGGPGDGATIASHSELEFGCKFKLSSVTDIVDGTVGIMGMLVAYGGPPQPYLRISLVRTGGVFKLKAQTSLLAYDETEDSYVESPDHAVDTGFHGPDLVTADTEYEVRCKFTWTAGDPNTTTLSIYFGGTWSTPVSPVEALPSFMQVFLTVGPTAFVFYDPDVAGPNEAAFQVLMTDAYYKSPLTQTLSYPSGVLNGGRKSYVGGVLASSGPAIKVLRYDPDDPDDPDDSFGPVFFSDLEYRYFLTTDSPEVVVLPNFSYEEGVAEYASLYIGQDGPPGNSDFVETDTYTLVHPFLPYGSSDGVIPWEIYSVAQAYGDDTRSFYLPAGAWVKIQNTVTDFGSRGFVVISSGTLEPILPYDFLSKSDYNQKIESSAGFRASPNTGTGDVTIMPEAGNFYTRDNSGGMDIAFYTSDPGVYFGTAYLDVINVEGAGPVSFSEDFTKVIGADLVTTDIGDKFRISITSGPAGVLAIVVPMQ